jgi:hypothetical protein
MSEFRGCVFHLHSLKEFFFILFLNLSLNHWRNPINKRFTLDEIFLFFCLWLRHPHHRIRHPVRFLLVLIPGLPSLKLCLNSGHHTLYIRVTMSLLKCK